jgi:AmiR/NasT family two-component response regulator
MTRSFSVDDRLVREVEELREANAQLLEALASRVVIEQAKGVLAERYGVEVAAAFEALRRAARDQRRTLHELAASIVAETSDPARHRSPLDRRAPQHAIRESRSN